MDDDIYQTGPSPRRNPTYGRMSVWLLFYVVAVALVASANALAGPCDAPVLNPIVCENSKPGNPPSEWDISGAGAASIQGFATDISVNQGGTVRFKIDTDATAYRIDIYRLGYYNGMGARLVDTVLPSAAPQIQPLCFGDSATGLIDCGNWQESAAWTVPSDATSGIYFAKLVREDGTPGTSHIVFVVRDDNGASELLFQTSDTTWQAYNDYGGNSLYTGAPVGRAYKVSYNRPFNTRGNQYSRAWLFGAEYPMVRWIEANGYDVSYSTGVDSDRRGAELLEHAAFLSVGHDEYWSAAQRTNVEAARNAGIHLAFFSGNEVFWKTRWESSIDGSGKPYRTLVSYKETHANAKIDPLPNVWTGTWRDPRFSPPADGGRPENALTGTIFTMNCCREDSIKVPEALGKLRFWRNTSVATLAPGQVATLARGVIGYEADEALDNGFRPPGLVKLSSTTLNVGSYLLDYGSTYGSGTATHSLTEYRHSSGALVFSAGTIRWPWGLDVNHDFDAATPNVTTTPDIRMQQATVNLFADMGVQPATLQSGLVAATPPPPTLTVLSPSSATAGGSGFTLTTTGSNFVRGSVVRWNGANRTTTFVNPTQLTAGIPAADIASPGAAQVVTAANPDGAVSNALTFTIAPPPPDTTPPTVTSALPADGATGVSTTTTVSAGFSEPMDQATISTTTVKLAAGSNPPVSATVTYTATTKTATLTPSSALGAGVLYTATVQGGAGGAKDVAGNALATDFSWSFTTATTQTVPVAVADTFLYRAKNRKQRRNRRRILRTVNAPGPLGLGVLANDTDADNHPLTAQLVSGSLTGGGTLNLASDGSFTYRRATNSNTVSFRYRANDGSALSEPATGTTVNLRVDAAPTTAGDNCRYNRSANTVTQPTRCTVTGTRVVQMNVVLNDTDPNVTTNTPTDGVGLTVVPGTMLITVAGSGVTVNANSACGQGALGTLATRATLTNNCDGTVTVTMRAINIRRIVYSYRVRDDLGAQSAAQQVTLRSVP
ncbi:MAG: Ig-like domain-containing protein [Pseudomonadota bacterium]|nr:Ig-like domain-containing protein [Pseudomonadota bacterium]